MRLARKDSRRNAASTATQFAFQLAESQIYTSSTCKVARLGDKNLEFIALVVKFMKVVLLQGFVVAKHFVSSAHSINLLDYMGDGESGGGGSVALHFAVDE
jgi:hypothetical protein